MWIHDQCETMPHLQFEVTIAPDPKEKAAYADAIAEYFADYMETGTGHVAVTIRTYEDSGYYLGRLDPGEPALMLNGDIRQGRSFDQQRGFVLAAFDEAHDRFDIPTENMYAALTQHTGEEFHEYDRVLADWDQTEAEEGAD